MSIPEKIGRYEIVDELGHGAMGSVLRARDPAMNRTVAVKTILAAALASDKGAEYRQRFYREARAAGALAHPGIVPVFDVGEYEDTPYLVMEFVDGQTISDALRKGERFSMDRVCELGQQIADALGYAHKNGIIHRDIKPANILLTSRATYGAERARITDFGVAKLAAGEITTTGQLLGTPAFMPPEQFTGGPIDGRADLFSLGVILYSMATGEQPFPGATMTAVSYKIVHTEPVAPIKLNPAVPAALDAVIMKCLEKNPAQRYQTGEELARALAEVRAQANAGVLATGAGQMARARADVEETIAVIPRFAAGMTTAATVAATAATRQMDTQAAAAPAGKKLPVPMIAAVVVLAAVAGVGGYWMLHRSQPAPATPTVQPAQAPAPAEAAPAKPSPNGAAPAKPLAAESAPQRPSPGPVTAPAAAAGAFGTATNNTSAPPATGEAPQAHPATVGFDPKALDPGKNTRLKIDLSHFPAGLAVTIEMNGKVYFKGLSGDKAAYDNLCVPPGTQQFRVVVSGGGVRKTSNAVQEEFVAKKRMTLKVELQPGVASSAETSPRLDPATQVLATLKADHFFF